MKLAFPKGQRGNPTVPDLGSTLFSRILKKYGINLLFIIVLFIICDLKRMIEKNVENRFDSTKLFDNLMVI